MVWDDGSIVPFAPEILFTFSSDGGTTWSTQKNISNTTRSSSTRSNITVDSQGAISVVWLEGSGGVFFTRSTDGGGTWSVPKSVSGQNAPTMIFAPAIAVDDRGRIYVAWSVANGQTFFTRSTDEGTTFSLPKAISEGKPTLAPSLALDNRDETLYIAWSDGSSGTAGVLFAMSRDMGETFSSPVDISRSSEIPSMEPRIITDRKGTIWAIWTEFLPGNPEIFVVHSNDGGNTFSQPQNISNLPGNSWLPGISTGPAGDVDVVWEQGMKEAILFSKLAKH